MNGSAIVYRGPSPFIDAPIVAIVTGLSRPTANPKTGHMAQLWILRADVDPISAVNDRSDYAICGDCALRGAGGLRARPCYVTVKNAPLVVYKAFKAGHYPDVSPEEVNAILRRKHLPIRLGAYGEPVCLPLWALADLTAGVRWTGYTHQWRAFPQYAPYLMASCDTWESARVAREIGWRVFRSRAADEPLHSTEIACPASAEMDHRSTCARCNLCDGKHSDTDARKHIAIVAHGPGAAHFLEFRR